MANAISVSGVNRSYSTDQRDERTEVDPSRALTMREVDDLRWLWNHAAAEFGVHCVFGAQLDAAEQQQLSKAAKDFERTWKRQVTRARQGWRPSKRPPTKQQRSSRTTIALIALLDHLEIDREMMSADGNCQVRGPSPEQLDACDLSEQRMYMHAAIHSVKSDPYENDHVLVAVARARRILSRLLQIDESHRKVLSAVYGPVVNGESREAFRKRFGELTEVVVQVVAHRREDGDPPARAVLRAKLTDDTAVHALRHAAGRHLRNAAEAYAATREAIPIRTTQPRSRNYPVYGPGPIGSRPLLHWAWR